MGGGRGLLGGLTWRELSWDRTGVSTSVCFGALFCGSVL